MKQVLHDFATSARRQAPWWLLGATGLALVPVLVAGERGLEFWRWTMIAAALVAGLMSRFANRNPMAYGIIILVGVVHLVYSAPFGTFSVPVSLSHLDSIGDLSVSLGLAGLLASATIRRSGLPKPRDLVDVMVVFLAASISTWVLLTQPLLDAGIKPLDAALISSFIPVNVLISTFLIDLWTDGMRQNRALQLASVASVLMLGGSNVIRLELVAAQPSDSPIVPFVGYSLAAGFMFAAMSHEHFQQHLIGTPAERPYSESKPRITIMGASVLVAVTLMSTIAPAGDTDLLARGIGTLLMIVLVVVRLVIALSQQAEVRATLQRRINLDDLTGLPTRTRFVEIVGERLEQNWRTGRHPTVLHLNIDRFKHINDSLGHQGANQVLAEIARRLEDVAKASGADVGRLGGDDFVIVDGSTRGLAEARERVESVRVAIGRPMIVNEMTVVLSASIGIAVAPEKRATNPEEMLRRADIANHQAKLEGASRSAVFDDTMQANVASRMELEHALHGAIGRSEMQLFHQPIIEIASGRVTGFESLIRWRRPNGELVSPGAFISIAEDTGIICEIGAWAITDALLRLREWIDTAVVAPDTTISVNVSPRQIADPNFAQIVRTSIDAAGVPARLLWLEITESMMLDEPELAERTLSDLRAMGIRIALDDFGTGFSSLSLLQRFPIDRIKIDRAFVQGIADNTNDRSLVRTIIAMAHSMGLDLVAEGVETVHQLQGLRDLGCAKAQGYLISHPVPADAMRTTMSALGELASLSVFASDAVVETYPAIDDYAPVATDTAPVPLGSGSRGQLGQPVL